MSKPRQAPKKNQHFIWYSPTCQCWFVNMYGDSIHGDAPTLPEAMDWLRGVLTK